jgi:hypothetical protein
MAGSYEEIFVPEMTVEHPVCHFNAFGMNVILDGRQQVQAVYQPWTQSGQRVFYAAGEKLAAEDNMITSTATISQQTPGNLLAAASAGVDATATYLLANVQHMIWPYDERSEA